MNAGEVERRHRLAITAMIALALIWGYNWVVIKLAVRDAAPFAFAAWRTLGGGIALALIGAVLRKPLRPQQPGKLFLIGLFQTALFVGLVTWAIVDAGAGKVAMLAYTMPLWVALLAWPFLGERLRWPQWLAIALAFAGIACLIGRLQGALADGLAVAAGCSWAIGIIFAKRVQRDERIDVFNMTMWQLLFGGALLTVVALAVPEHATHWSVSYALALAYNVLPATALAYLLWLFVLDTLPAREASMGTLANPVVGVFAAWIQLGERPSVLQAAGMASIVAALLVISFAGRNRDA